jgi:hypothetical protein
MFPKLSMYYIGSSENYISSNNQKNKQILAEKGSGEFWGIVLGELVRFHLCRQGLSHTTIYCP